MSGVVELAAHAKLNLFLRILAREADGYHGIETLFCGSASRTPSGRSEMSRPGYRCR